MKLESSNLSAHQAIAIGRRINMCVNAGVESSAIALANRLIQNFDFPRKFGNQPLSEFIGFYCFHNRAQKGLSFLKMTNNPLNHILLPAPVPRDINIKPKVGSKVYFSYWEGNKAPETNYWTGIIVDKVRRSGILRYLVKRDYDQIEVELVRHYIHSYA